MWENGSMRKSWVLTAMASLVAATACCASASAHGYGETSRDRWYAAYERHREARERYRAEREERAYERHMAWQRRLAERRNRVYDRGWDTEHSRWRRDAYRTYRDYEGYCDCPE